MTADRVHVDKAVDEGRCSRAPSRPKSPCRADLGGMVDRLLARSALGALGLARKAGAVALGAAKVEAAVRSGAALFVLHAPEASDDGVRKIDPGEARDSPSRRPGNRCLQTFLRGRIGFGIGRHKCDTCCRSRGGRGKGGSEAHGCA